MRVFEKIVIGLGVIALIAGVLLFTPPFAKTSNCGGNSAVISSCKGIMLNLQLATENLGDHFSISQLSPETKTDIVRLANNHWITGAKILIRTNITSGVNSNQIVVVCDTAYGNVPQTAFWNGYRRNLAHVAGSSDGTAVLISPADFKKLNLAGFIDASLLATNKIVKVENGTLK